MSVIITPNQLRSGDVILFASDESPRPDGLWNKMKWWFFTKVTRRIKEEANSNYTHAAICYDSDTIAQAPKPRYPVEKVSVADAVAGCKFAVVFRSSFAYLAPVRVQKLKAFLDKVVADGATYNWWGLFRFSARKEKHFQTLKERLDAHFAGQGANVSFDSNSYFCSELVGACLCVIDAIEPSAAIVYDPRVTSPTDLGRDPTWGTFIGYMVPDPATEIPEDDEFYHNAPLPIEMGGVDYDA